MATPTKNRTKKNTYKRKPKNNPRKKKRKGISLWWGLLLGGVLVVIAYIVILYHFFVVPLSFRWKGMFGEPDYPKGFSVHGIDISHYQQNIDWETLRNAKVNEQPLRFVIIKATEGISLTDENFNDNFYRAKENDLIRGAYHFYTPRKDATKQAKFFLKQVHLEAGDLPPVLDIELRGSKPLKEFQRDIQCWLDIVQKEYGIAPIIYTNLDFKKNYLNDSIFDAYPLWIANYYKKELKYNGTWTLWQYTDCGHVDGITNNVDFNLLNGDMQTLQQLLIPDKADTNH